MKKSPILFVSVLGLLFTSCDNQNKQNKETTTQTETTQEQPKQLSNKEQDFIKEAAQDGMLEVQLGQLAHQKAMSKDVKDFAHHMMMEHEKANKELKQLATKKNVMIPDSISSNMQNKKEDLAKLSGKEFDKKYMKEMLDEHKQDVSDFEEMAEKAEDPELRAWAQQTLPTLRSHYMEAQKLDSMMNASGKKKSMGKTSMR